MSLVIDHIDSKILNYIEEQGGAENLKKVAKKLNIPVQTVHQRVSKLKERGIIKKVHYELDTEKLGFPFLGLVVVNVTDERVIEELHKKFGKSANNVISFESFGSFDYLLGVYVESPEQWYEIRDELKKFPGVDMINSVYVGKKFRFSTVPFPLSER